MLRPTRTKGYKNMKTKIQNLIILDASGSMEMIKQETISGLNEVIESCKTAQRRYPEQTHVLTLVAFNSEGRHEIYYNVLVNLVKEIADDDYQPSCCTPLYDAMGFTLTKMERVVSKDDKVLVTIITDGLENASKEYTHESVRALVEHLKEKGWVFSYIGANQDADAVGNSFEITNTLNFHASSQGARSMFGKLLRSRGRWYKDIADGIVNEDNFFDEDDKDK